MKLRSITRLSAVSVGSVLAACCVSAVAADRWWDGGTTDIATAGDGASAGTTGTWNTSTLNWDQGSTLAHVAWNNGSNDTAIFGGTGGTVTLGTAISANSLIFAHTSGTYTVSGSNALTLGGTAPGIFAANTTNFSASLIGSNGLAKSGAGLLALKSGTGNPNLTGGLAVNQGIVELDLNSMSAAAPSNMIASGNTLTLNNGYLRVRGKTSATGSQTLGAVTLSGSTGLNITHQTGAGTVTTLTLGAITRNAGSTLSFTTPTIAGTTGDFYVPTATNLGNWAVTSVAGLSTAASIRYATADGTGKVTALTGTGVTTATLGTDPAANYEITDAGGTAPAAVSANSIRYGGAAGTTTLGASFTANSLMNGGQGTGTGLWTIGATANAGTIAIGGSNELLLHPGANGMTINSRISGSDAGLTVNAYYNGTNAVAVTLGGTNTYTGKTIVNGSNSYASGGHVIGNTLADAGSAFGAGGELILNGATLRTTPTAAQTTNRNMTWNGNSGIYIANSNPAQTVTFSGSISGSGTFSVDHNGSSGALILSGDNSYSGEILLNQTDSKLTIASANAAKNATLSIAGQRVSFAFAGDKAFNIGGLKGNAIDIALGTGLADGGSGFISLGSNNQTNAYLGSLSGAAGLIKQGAGTQSLLKTTYTGNTVIEAGTLKLTAVATTTLGTMTVSQDSTLVKARIVISGSNVPGYAVGQTVKVNGQTDNEIWGIGFDTINTYLYLKSPLATGSYSGSVESLNGSLASTTIEVQAGAYLDVTALSGGLSLTSAQTLKGAGAVIGSLTVGGTLAPGASVESLATGALTMSSGSTFAYEVGADHSADLLAVDGVLSLTGVTLALDAATQNHLALGDWAADSKLTLISYKGSAITSGFTDFTDDAEYTFGSNKWKFDYDDSAKGANFPGDATGSQFVTLTLVPEPSTLMLCAFGLLTLRRRRSL